MASHFLNIYENKQIIENKFRQSAVQLLPTKQCTNFPWCANFTFQHSSLKECESQAPQKLSAIQYNTPG